MNVRNDQTQNGNVAYISCVTTHLIFIKWEMYLQNLLNTFLQVNILKNISDIPSIKKSM